MTIKKTFPTRLQHVITLKNWLIWDHQLASTWSLMDDLDMERLLGKEEDTRIFRIVRRKMSKRRRWMLKSRAFKTEVNKLHIRSLRARACTYLFSSRWQKHYSVGMQRKRAAQSSWRRLKFLMERNPCLWKSLQTLNIMISLSDLISVLDSHPD